MTYLVIPNKLTIKRRSGWGELRRAHIKLQSHCQCCGRTDILDVHHIVPVWVNRDLELESANLITLCRATKNNKTYCHFMQGHLGIDWHHYDYNIVKRAEMFRESLGML